MNKITTTDGTPVHVNDWGNGHPTGLSPYWPANMGALEERVVLLALLGFRCISRDPQGDAQSNEPWWSNSHDSSADDLPGLIYTIDLNEGIHLGCFLDGEGSFGHQGSMVRMATSYLCIKS